MSRQTFRLRRTTRGCFEGWSGLDAGDGQDFESDPRLTWNLVETQQLQTLEWAAKIQRRSGKKRAEAEAEFRIGRYVMLFDYEMTHQFLVFRSYARYCKIW